MSNLLDIYQNIISTLKSEHKISWAKNMQAEKLAVSSKKINLTDLQQTLNDFAPTQGWYQTLDSLFQLKPNQTAIKINLNDPINCGEFINAKGQSLHLRAQGSQLIATTYYPDQGDTLFSAKYSQLIQSQGTPNGQKAIYKLYWDINNTNQPKYSRFLKIQTENK